MPACAFSRLIFLPLALAFLVVFAGRAAAMPQLSGTAPDGNHLVRFRLTIAPTSTGPALAGSFTGWTTPLAMTAAGAPGAWEVTVPLAPGTHEYKFVLPDGAWIADPANTATSGDFGNSVFVLEGPRLTAPGESAAPPVEAPAPATAPAAAPEQPPFPPLVTPLRSLPRWPFLALGGGLVVVLLLHGRPGGAASPPRLQRACVAAALFCFALLLRVPLVLTLQPDMDEPVYLPIAQRFAAALTHGDVRALITEPEVREHPRLGFLLHGGMIALSRAGEFFAALDAARFCSALLGAATAAVLAWRWPVAALLWAMHGIALRYTTVAYLDAAVAFFATTCVVLFDAAVRRLRTRGVVDSGVVALFVASAVASGCVVSSKYLGAVAPIALAVWFCVLLPSVPASQRLRAVGGMAGYVVLALVAMVATDPMLWGANPAAGVWERIQFHRGFATGDLVRSVNYPWYQPMVWLWEFTRLDGRIGWPWVDRAVMVLGLGGILLGLVRATERSWALAGLLTLLFLFLWPTKWPQYETALVPWLAVGAEAVLLAVAGLVPGILAIQSTERIQA